MKKNGLIVLGVTLCGAFAWYILVENSKTLDTPTPDVTATQNKTVLPTVKQKFIRLYDDSLSWQTRINEIKLLEGRKLSENDITFMYAFFADKPKGMSAEYWYVIANELMLKLRTIDRSSERFMNEMQTILENQNYDPIIRDYAAQHLMAWILPLDNAIQTKQDSLSKESETRQHPHLEKALRVISSTIQEPKNQDTTIPGSSLNSMSHTILAGIPDEVVNAELKHLEPWLLKVIRGDVDTKQVNRVSAINSVAQIGGDVYYQAVRELLESETLSYSIQLPSVATLGQLGKAQDIELLEKLAKEKIQLKHAANAAIRKIQKRR